MNRPAFSSLLVLALTGCASTMSGFEGQGKFACQAPDGISCASLSGVYANALQNNLPGQVRRVEAATGEPSGEKITRPVPSSGEPIRSTQKVRRVWLAPWEDDDEVLHDQSYLYFVVDPGRWQVEHARRQAGERYRPVLPPNALAPAVTNPGERPVLRMERANPANPAPATLPVPPMSGRDLLPPAAEGE